MKTLFFLVMGFFAVTQEVEVDNVVTEFISLDNKVRSVNAGANIPLHELDSYITRNSDPEIYFIGMNPDYTKEPDFKTSLLNKIDVNNEKYFLELKTLIYLSDLTLDQINSYKKMASYKVIIEIEGNDINKISRFTEKKLNIGDADLHKNLFYESITSFRFDLEPGDYDITVRVLDVVSGISSSNNYDFTLRDYRDQDILIGDMEIYDYDAPKPFISYPININNRKNFFRVKFDSYQKNLNDNISFSYEINKEYYVLEKVLKGIESSLDFIFDIFKPNSLQFDTLQGAFFVKSFDKKRKKKFMSHSFTVDKSLFDKLEFFKFVRSERVLYSKISVRKQVSETRKIDENEIVSIDSVDADKFDYSKNVVGDEESIISIEDQYDFTQRFSFFWEFIPQTEHDMKLTVVQMQYLEAKLNDEHKKIYSDFRKNFSKYSPGKREQLYMQIWKHVSDKHVDSHPFLEMKKYFKKLEYAKENFPTVSIEGNNVVLDVVDKSWRSDKTRIYMVQGLPSEISGENYFTRKLQLISRQHLPYQKWKYSNGDTYYFRGDQLIR